MRPGSIALLTAAWAGLAGVCHAQKTVNWRVFRTADGLASPVCSSVTVDVQGKVLVSHPDSPLLTEYGGYGMSDLPAPAGSFARFYASPAGQIWTINRDGLQEFRDGQWIVHPPNEFGVEPKGMSNAWYNESVICPVRQGLVILLLPDRLVQFSSEWGHGHRVEVLRQAKDTGLGNFISLAPASDGGLWISGSQGIGRMSGPLRSLTAQSGWRDFVAPESWRGENFRGIHESPIGEVTLLARSASNHAQVMIASFNGQAWSAAKVVNEPLQQAWRGTEKTWWATTRNALLQYSEESAKPIESREISPRQFFDAAVEPSGVFWLATSDGLFRHAPLCWQFDKAPSDDGVMIQCLSTDPQGGIWFIAENGLHWRNQEDQRDYLFPSAMAELLKTARGIYPLKRALAIETERELVKFDTVSNTFTVVAEGPKDVRRFKVLGLIKDGVLALEVISAGHEGVLRSYDGSRVSDLELSLPEPAIGALSALFVQQNGDIWLSGDKGSAWLHEKKWRIFSPKDKSAPEGGGILLEMADGKVWCAGRDRLWEFDGKNWLALRRGFDGITSMVQTRDGSVWVASNNGLFRFLQGIWIENGVEDGLPAMNIRALCEDKSDHLWAATSSGLSLFQPKADTDPPRTEIRDSPKQELHIPEGGNLSISYGGQDKWKLTAGTRLLYSQHLDGREWSPFAESDGVSFSDLTAGKHYFQVRAMDRNGNVDPKPASLEFAVLVPWYREARLVFISSAGAAVALFFAALAFNRHRRLLRSYAEVEKKVAQRTLELERANRELLHSQKMNALGTLAAGIAHDFNNILSIIKGSAQIIEENVDDPKKIGTRVERIKTVVEQGAGIVKAMLGFSRESDEQAGPCDLNEAVRDTIKLLGDRFVREVQINFKPAAELPGVLCSKDLIQQILLNFIFNAAESMAKAKRIELSTRVCEKLPENAVLVPAPATAYACVAVQDNGAGIAPEILPRIFEPFFTTKALSARRGTGLGLSMVYEFAKKMHAGLAVSSVVDQGSTFTLILPLSKPEGTSTSAETVRKEDHVTT